MSTSEPTDLVPLPANTVGLTTADQVEESLRPDVFYVPPAGKGEASDRVGCRLPMSMVSSITRLIESGKFGWEDRSAFFRWALELGITKAAVLMRDERFSNELMIEQAILRRHQARQREKRFSDMVSMVVGDIRDLLQQGAFGNARMEFRRSVEDIRSLNVTSIRERFLNTLSTEFPQLWREVVEEVPELAQQQGNGAPIVDAPLLMVDLTVVEEA